ncbi:MAG TPA: hypothetical protein P5523_09165 [Bacteroidales bacterium]|nr:hypothetical protein [Bacteroidales bacterium]
MSLRAAFDTAAADNAAVMSNFRQTLIQYEGQVAALLQENEQLKKEIESLRSEAKTFDTKEK